MRAIALNEWGGRDRLELMDLPDPKVGPDTVLIDARAAGVNPVDFKIREGYLAELLPHHFPLILGWDVAGVVAAVGPAVTGFAAGDEVYSYCRKPSLEEGTYAERVAVQARHVAAKPSSLDFTQAAAVPLAGLTAYQALFDALELQSGESVLIQAAAGGVGSFAVQLAARAGAHVIGTASARNHEHVRELGAAEVIDYTQTDVAEAIRGNHPEGVDAVFDMVGGETLTNGFEMLRDGGRLASIAQPPALGEEQQQRGLSARYVFVEPRGDQLAELARAIDAGELAVHVEEVLPLERAADAHERLEAGHVRGKLVLSVG